jgi:hypothetical protein
VTQQANRLNGNFIEQGRFNILDGLIQNIFNKIAHPCVELSVFY